jgi:histidine triad (HIT) family protein
MHNHAPQDYICPICLGIKGIEDERTMIRKSDIVFQDDLVTVFIGSFFVGNNPGHPIIVPNEHFENLYDLSDEYAHRIIDVSKKIAIALKSARKCDGVMVLQNNEPASNQHAFHYHMHLFPRFDNDKLHENMAVSTKPTVEERLPYAQALKKELV